jgi:hypothetical protein
MLEQFDTRQGPARSNEEEGREREWERRGAKPGGHLPPTPSTLSFNQFPKLPFLFFNKCQISL